DGSPMERRSRGDKTAATEGIDTEAKRDNVYVRSTEVRSGGANSNGRTATEIDRTARNDPISLQGSDRRFIGDGDWRIDAAATRHPNVDRGARLHVGSGI
ncbi:MAG TPA: hypothetical protein VFQ80_03745, partial [Thermomicrobiales bacterium]|nr:hypothetical protein [Thermomicrobiales bacterium]